MNTNRFLSAVSVWFSAVPYFVLKRSGEKEEKKAGQSGKIEYSLCFIPRPPFLLIRFVLAIGGSLPDIGRRRRFFIVGKY